MSESTKYIKIVEWSDENECFVGYCPGIIGPCCHGDNEIEVFRQLCEIVDELLAHAQERNKPLPQPTVGRNLEEILLSA